MGYSIFILCCFCFLQYGNAQCIYRHPSQLEIIQPANMGLEHFSTFIQGSTDQEARHKLVSPLTVKSKVNGFSRFAESETERWPVGTWNSGYYDRWEDGFPAYALKINDCPINERTGDKLSPEGFLSSHPLHSINGKVIRALIHANHRYPDASWVAENNRKIKSGMDYMIAQQQTNISAASDFYQNEEGGFTKWYFRPDSLVPNLSEDIGQNYSHLFETAHALRSMCEAYMYFQNTSEPYGKQSGNAYSMANLYSAIIKAANNIVRKSLGSVESNGTAEMENACDWVASNYRGLGLWAITGAYKVANYEGDFTHALSFYNKAKEISDRLIRFQTADNSLEDGMWLTGGSSGDNDGCGHEIFKDTYIWYHQLIMRGIVEMVDVTRNSDSEWKDHVLIPAVKKAVNHLIKYRVAYNDVKADTNVNWNHGSNTWVNIEKGTLRTTWTSVEHTRTCPTWAYYYYEEVLEPIAMLALYSKYQTNFSCEERSLLRNLLLTIGLQSHGGYNPADPNTIEQFVQYAYYNDYFNAFEIGHRIFPLHENNSILVCKETCEEISKNDSSFSGVKIPDANTRQRQPTDAPSQSPLRQKPQSLAHSIERRPEPNSITRSSGDL
jgi:hypothetical protein